MVLGWAPTMGLEYTAKNCDQENSCVLYRFFLVGGCQLDMATSIAPMNAFDLRRGSCGQCLEGLLRGDFQKQLRISTVRLFGTPATCTSVLLLVGKHERAGGYFSISMIIPFTGGFYLRILSLAMFLSTFPVHLRRARGIL